jgi:immune inhibitor A
VNYNDIPKLGVFSYIDQNVTKSELPGIVRINLPDKEVKGIQPAFGKKYYYSTKGDDLSTSLETPVFDLTNATTANFDFKTLYEIDFDYDYLYVNVLDENGKLLKEHFDVLGDENVNGGFDYKGQPGVTTFDDSKSYMNDLIPDAGRKVPNYGLQFRVIGEAKDNFAGAVWIKKN